MQQNAQSDISSPIETAGFGQYPILHTLMKCTILPESITLEWSDGHCSEYHNLWLRDNCPCSECISSLTREQIFEICDVPLELSVTSAIISQSGRLEIHWAHLQHKSVYHPGWLRSHCYSDNEREKRQLYPTIWDADQIKDELPCYQAQDVLTDDAHLLSWLKQQRDYGICLIKNLATAPGSLLHVAQRISFIRETNFGTLFDVKNKPDANTAAYTTLRLPLHTDLPTRELQPGLQFLHCLVNDAQGGESILVDGFKIADYMRTHHPQEFEALCTLPIDFYNKDKNSDYRFRGTAIVRDTNGIITEVRLANFLRGPLDLPAHQVQDLYKGYRQFMLLTREPRFQFFYRLNAGDLVVFDNRRVLHARNAFNLEQGERHLQGCYIDRDELLSRIRILERTEVC